MVEEQGLGWSRPCLTDKGASEEERHVGSMGPGDGCEFVHTTNRSGWEGSGTGIRLRLTGAGRTGRTRA